MPLWLMRLRPDTSLLSSVPTDIIAVMDPQPEQNPAQPSRKKRKIPLWIRITRRIPTALLIGAVIWGVLYGPNYLRERLSTPDEIKANGIKSFQNDCVDYVLQGGNPPSTCKSYESIKATYHVEANVLLNTQQERMISTAQKIAKGEITNNSEYRECIKKGECVTIPTPQVPEQKAEFWHLVNDGRVTQANCQAMEICRALVKLGLFPEPPPLTEK